MSLMANPLEALVKFQESVSAGGPIDPSILDESYAILSDEINGGVRNSFAKIIDGEVQAISIFGLSTPIDGVTCFSVGYAVTEKHRGRGLGIEAVNKGVKELVKAFSKTEAKSFYIEALVDMTNVYSINVAKKLFSSQGVPTRDKFTGTPAFYFKRLISLR